MNFYINHFKVDKDKNEFYYFLSGNFRKLTSKQPEPNVALLTDAHGFLPFKVISGDFGGGFSTFTPPETSVPTLLIAIDENTTTPGYRLYVYTGEATGWKYVDLS